MLAAIISAYVPETATLKGHLTVALKFLYVKPELENERKLHTDFHTTMLSTVLPNIISLI